jgi:hypothetical protein
LRGERIKRAQVLPNLAPWQKEFALTGYPRSSALIRGNDFAFTLGFLMHAHDQELASFLSSSSFSVSAAATSLHPILEVWSKLEIHILDNVRILKRLYDSKQPERLTQMLAWQNYEAFLLPVISGRRPYWRKVHARQSLVQPQS